MLIMDAEWAVRGRPLWGTGVPGGGAKADRVPDGYSSGCFPNEVNTPHLWLACPHKASGLMTTEGRLRQAPPKNITLKCDLASLLALGHPFSFVPHPSPGGGRGHCHKRAPRAPAAGQAADR